MSRVPRPRTVELQFPVAGLNRRLGYKQQPPFTTPDAQNVRPDGTLLGRRRGGSRPGLINHTRTQIASGSFPIRMLSSVRYEDTSGLTVWNDDMLGSGDVASSNRWDLMTGPTRGPELSGGLASSEAGDGDESVLLVTGVSGVISATSAHEVGIHIVPFEGRHYGRYRIYLRLVGTDPLDDGIICELDWGTTLGGTANDGIVEARFYVYKGTTLVHTSSIASSNEGFETSGWFSARTTPGVSPAETLTVHINDQQLFTYDYGTAHGLSAGNRCGFGMIPDATPTTGKSRVDRFRLMYHNTDTNPNKSRDLLMASAGGQLWREDMPGMMKDIGTYTSSIDLASTTRLQAIDYQGKLYIADHDDPKLLATNVEITGGSSDQLDSTDVTDWTAVGVDPDKHVVQITEKGSATGDITGTYTIASVTADKVTISPGASEGATGVTAHIVRYAKIYDPVADSLSTWKDSALAGTPAKSNMPAGFSTIARWRDRLVLGGGRSQPHLWFMSKRGDPEDFDIASTLVGRAVAGTSADAGQLGQPLVALIPHSDDCLLFLGKTSCWVMRGDPTMGGQLDKLSDHIGIVSNEAYAYTAEEDLVFLSHDGLYSIPAGCGQPPISLSREMMPDDLRGVDQDTHVASMAYDVAHRGIHIFTSRKLDAATSGTPTSDHFWFDMETKSFWPVAFAVANHEPVATYDHTSLDTPSSGVVMGGRDGYLRTFNRHADQDDGGNVITSFVNYGPLRMAQMLEDGVLQSLDCVTAENSGDVDCDVYVGNSHEAAFGASSFATDTFGVGGRNRTFRPRARGASLMVKLSNNTSSDRPWAVELLVARIRRAGRTRIF